jgi:hypothetical protein
MGRFDAILPAFGGIDAGGAVEGRGKFGFGPAVAPGRCVGELDISCGSRSSNMLISPFVLQRF